MESIILRIGDYIYNNINVNVNPINPCDKPETKLLIDALSLLAVISLSYNAAIASFTVC